MHPIYTQNQMEPPKKTSKQTVKRSSGAKRRFRIVMFAFVCFMAWAGFTFWEQSSVLNEKLSTLQQLETELAHEQQENEQIQRQITRLHDPEYIEQRLRSDFLMVKDGEILFIKKSQ